MLCFLSRALLSATCLFPVACALFYITCACISGSGLAGTVWTTHFVMLVSLSPSSFFSPPPPSTSSCTPTPTTPPPQKKKNKKKKKERKKRASSIKIEKNLLFQVHIQEDGVGCQCVCHPAEVAQQWSLVAGVPTAHWADQCDAAGLLSAHRLEQGTSGGAAADHSHYPSQPDALSVGLGFQAGQLIQCMKAFEGGPQY